MSILTDPVSGEQFNYLTRGEWGARKPRRRGGLVSTTNGTFMHHTVTGTAPSASIWRGVQNYHMDGRGWNDIAYSFGVDVVTGQILEGRGLGVAGGHTRNFNSTSHAITWIANTDNVDPSPQAKRAWLAVLRTIEAHYGQGPRRGHRDVAKTGCPGRHGYDWLRAGFPTSTGAPAPPQPKPTAKPKPKPTAKPKPSSSSGMLKRGSKGSQVKSLQSRLNKLGAKLAEDGDFGPATEFAVKQFQQFWGLLVDGIVGPKTMATIDKVEAMVKAPKPAAQVSRKRPTIKQYAKGQAVRDLQRFLKIKVDGKFGPQTERAVKGFQTFWGLEVDGVVGPKTWGVIDWLQSF